MSLGGDHRTREQTYKLMVIARDTLHSYDLSTLLGTHGLGTVKWEEQPKLYITRIVLATGETIDQICSRLRYCTLTNGGVNSAGNSSRMVS